MSFTFTKMPTQVTQEYTDKQNTKNRLCNRNEQMLMLPTIC